MKFTVKIVPSDQPTNKLADAEVHFESGLLTGLKLVGFAVWQMRSGTGLNVTFPARTYSVNGERRSYALLRPAAGDADAQVQVRDAILAAYQQFLVEARAHGAEV
jgi:hypothetical protein